MHSQIRNSSITQTHPGKQVILTGDHDQRPHILGNDHTPCIRIDVLQGLPHLRIVRLDIDGLSAVFNVLPIITLPSSTSLRSEGNILDCSKVLQHTRMPYMKALTQFLLTSNISLIFSTSHVRDAA